MIIAKQVGDRIELRLKSYLSNEQFKSVISRIKSIPGRKFEESSFWTIPVSEKGCLEKLFDKKELVWEEVLRDNVRTVPRTISTDTSFLDELLLQPYPFQIVGINFLCDMGRCMLADEMGLGKTSQIIAAAYKLYRKGKVNRALIMCPATLKYQWAEEIEKFLDVEEYDISYAVIDGDKEERIELYKLIENGDILYTIINYELVRNDIDILSKIKWDIIALDESHRIKNFKSKTFKAVIQLDAQYKWAATGTPMQNRPEELFNIFRWVDPKILGDWWKFRNRYMIIGEKFRQPNMILGYKNLDELHRRIAPYMLRRLKRDVAPELPDMIVKNYYVEMYSEQAQLHEEIRNDLYELIKEVSKYTVRDEDGNIIKQHPRANNILGMFVMLQEVCDTPELLLMSESKLAQKYVKKYEIDKRSPKLDELVNILSEFRESNPDGKAVIFTQFERMQRLIVDRIKSLGGVCIVNGQMSAIEKQQSVHTFRTSDNINFLVATDSANYGVNLPEASLAINVDLPWNPAVWDQRNARIHRLDSKHESVSVINLISLDSLDERILDTLYKKKSTAEKIIENTEDEAEYLSNLTNHLVRKLVAKRKIRKRKH